MSSPYPDRVRGELLSEWRTSQEWDLAALAQSANLSVAQIKQLESGGSSLFYTPAIKEAAARKLARLLGGDPDAVIQRNADSPDPFIPSVVEDLVALSQKKPSPAPAWPFLWRHPVLWFAPVLLLVGVMTASWLQQKWLNGGEDQFWKKTAFFNESPSVPTLSTEASSAQVQDVPVVSQPQLAVAEPEKFAGFESAGLLSTGKQAAIAVLPSLPVAAAADNNPLCQNQAPETVLTPSSPSKAGDMVHIVAQKSGRVCVEDATGSRTLITLRTNESRSVYGAPPWRVHFELPAQAQLYFQGVRLQFPNPELMTVALREGPRKGP
jgi:cytoskeleton protein RodZ